MPRALLVDDDMSSLSVMTELIELEGFSVDAASSVKDARALLQRHVPDVLITDLKLPDGSGIDLLKDADGLTSTDVVLITGHSSVDTAVEAFRLGVTDYLTKPVDIQRLKAILAHIARAGQLKGEIANLRGELRKLGRFGLMVGVSPVMNQIYDLIAKVAPTDATVLVTGESGTGKDLIAQTVQQLSGRRSKPMLPLNCAAVSPNLIESELFGHERGSFTGADRTHKGHFERASGGTLFLDEIVEMPIELQSKLLRVLETNTVMRIGGDSPFEVDVRIIAATNRDPAQAVKEGKLREDLLFRLNVFPIHAPPLRERGDDIDLLAEHMIQELSETEGKKVHLSQAAIDRMRAYGWPGNVRELKNVLHRAFILADREIGLECLPEQIRGLSPAQAPVAVAAVGDGIHVPIGSSVADAERRLIMATLDRLEGNKRETAKVLGISLKTLYNRLSAYQGN
jgi:DNA-binding NtrC family response regulator